jgi:hypothetical protein
LDARGMGPLGSPIKREHLQAVAAKRRSMMECGWVPLAVHTPWSPYARAPGKQPVGAAWRVERPEARLLRPTSISANTGMLADGLRVFDVDPKAPGFAAKVLSLLTPHLPRGALIRQRAGSDSVVMVLRAAEGEPGKLRVAGSEGAVEVLGAGQHVVVDGWHPCDPSGGVRWHWRGGRAPWTVSMSEVPTISEEITRAALQDVVASGALGAAIQQDTQTGMLRGRYPATERFRELLRQVEGHIRPAVAALIEEVGAAGTGRHDALVAIAGSLVHHGWRDDDAAQFVVPLANSAFGDGDWFDEVEAALSHARRRTRVRYAA